MTDQPNFETRVTEAEERALEAMEVIERELKAMTRLGPRRPAQEMIRVACDNVWDARMIIAAAAALARDYARKEG